MIDIIKEILIIILLCLAVVVILGVVFYNYIPINVVVPSNVQPYTTSKTIKEEIEEDARLGIVRYVRDEEYQNAMDELCMFTTVGKNEHDDAPDGLTQLSMFIEGGMMAKIEIPKNPFRGML